MKYSLINIYSYIFLSINLVTSLQAHETAIAKQGSLVPFKQGLHLLEQNNFQLQQIKGTSHLLGVKKSNKQYSLAIASDGQMHYITPKKDKINLYSGGSHLFIWKQDKKFVNTITQFNITNNEITEKKLSSKYTIYDIIQHNDEQFVYALDTNKEVEVLIHLTTDYLRYEFFEPAYAYALNDSFAQFKTKEQPLFLIEALPSYTPSLLCRNKQVLGYFFTKNASNTITCSHDGKRYVLRNNQHFLHHDYKKECTKTMKLDEQLWQNGHVQCMDFAGTDDIVIVCFLRHILLLSFYEDKHWVVQSNKELYNTFPLPQHEKTIILTQDNTFAELTYDHTKDAFALTYE